MGDPAYLKNLRKFGSGELTTEELAALEAELILALTELRLLFSLGWLRGQ